VYKYNLNFPNFLIINETSFNKAALAKALFNPLAIIVKLLLKNWKLFCPRANKFIKSYYKNYKVLIIVEKVLRSLLYEYAETQCPCPEFFS
jgi:hypothetical protein